MGDLVYLKSLRFSLNRMKDIMDLISLAATTDCRTNVINSIHSVYITFTQHLQRGKRALYKHLLQERNARNRLDASGDISHKIPFVKPLNSP